MHRSARTRLVAAAGALTTACGAFVLAAAPVQAASSSLTHQEFAKALLQHRSRFLTATAQRALAHVAGLDKPGVAFGGDEGLSPAAVAPTTTAPIIGSSAPRAHLANIRVNDPAADRYQIDQTTQSETSLTVSGSHVAVGFNDSQHALIAYTAALDLTGYAYSTNGGRTFTDGGVVPNRGGYTNIGDPWLASDRTGRMYYSTLTLDGQTGNGEIGVSLSGTGGRTWATPTIVSPNRSDLFYFGDKDAMTTGPDPTVRTRDNVYVTWDDTAFDPATGQSFNGLPIARSTNGGRSWALTYIDKIIAPPEGCSFSQYLGAQPFVDHADGRLYVAAEKISVDDPACTGMVNPTITQVVFTSTNGGRTFTGPVTISGVAPSVPVELGHGKIMRTAEFPSLAFFKGKVYATWNDGAGGADHIRLAVSANRGATWRTTTLTAGRDEVQPALTADRSGLHLAFYQKNRGDTLDVVLADSVNATSWKAAKVTSVSFPGVFTAPQFDPVIVPGYMGDYIANVSDGTHTYLAWGDNRDIVKNHLWPSGRHDPDVFFAKR